MHLAIDLKEERIVIALTLKHKGTYHLNKVLVIRLCIYLAAKDVLNIFTACHSASSKHLVKSHLVLLKLLIRLCFGCHYWRELGIEIEHILIINLLLLVEIDSHL